MITQQECWRNSASQGGLLEDASRWRAGRDPGRLQPSTTTATRHGFMPGRERERLSRAAGWPAAQAGVIQDQFRGERQQIRKRVEDRKAVARSRPPRGASRKQSGEVRHERGEGRAFGLPRSPHAWLIEVAAAAGGQRCCGRLQYNAR